MQHPLAASHMPAHNPGTFPEGEPNQQPPRALDNAQPTTLAKALISLFYKGRERAAFEPLINKHTTRI